MLIHAKTLDSHLQRLLLEAQAGGRRWALLPLQKQREHTIDLSLWTGISSGCNCEKSDERWCAGWWAETGAWVPRDWALRPGYDTRVAIINAMYACGENVQKLMPVLLTEAVRRDRRAPHPFSLLAVCLKSMRTEHCLRILRICRTAGILSGQLRRKSNQATCLTPLRCLRSCVTVAGQVPFLMQHRNRKLCTPMRTSWAVICIALSVKSLRCRFAMALTGPPQEVSVDMGQRHYTRSFLAATAYQVWEFSADVLRAVWLFILFMPLAATATLSLSYGIRREEWLVYLR